MKKYFLILVMLFTVSVCSFAGDSNVSETDKFEKYEFNINNRKLASFLMLSEDQFESVVAITDELSNDMRFAYYGNSAETRKKVIDNAIRKNIRHMRFILTREQYRKYLLVFNLTLTNRGFEL